MVGWSVAGRRSWTGRWMHALELMDETGGVDGFAYLGAWKHEEERRRGPRPAKCIGGTHEPLAAESCPPLFQQ